MIYFFSFSSSYLFIFFGQLMRHQLIELFHFSNLLQMLNDHRVANIEFLVNFSCSSKRISFDDPLHWLLSTSNGWSLCSSSMLLSPLQNFLNNNCTVSFLAAPGPNALLMLRIVSVALRLILN